MENRRTKKFTLTGEEKVARRKMEESNSLVFIPNFRSQYDNLGSSMRATSFKKEKCNVK